MSRTSPEPTPAVTVQDRRLGPLWFAAADQVMRPQIERDGVWEIPEGQWLDLVARPGMTVVDVGANVGYFALWAAGNVAPGGRVIAVEPHPGNLDLLRRNVARSGASGVEVVAAAASDRPGSLDLFLNDDNSGDHRVFPPATAAAADPAFAAASRGFTGPERTVTVPAVTVTDLVGQDRLDVLFTDTQGHDHVVLRGARDVLVRDRPLVMCEFAPAWIHAQGDDPLAVLAEWRALGYRIGVWDGGGAPGDWPDDRIVAYAAAPGRWFTNLELWPQERPLLPRAIPGAGFWRPEPAAGSARYWLVRPTGTIHLAGDAGRTTFRATLVPPPGRTVTVGLGDVTLTVSRPHDVAVPVELVAGRADLPVTVDGDPARVPGDPRPLRIALVGPRLA